MKFRIQFFSILLVLSSCSSNRYLLKDENKNGKKFLVNTIKEAKSNGLISSSKPIIVVDGVPYRYNHELNENKLDLVKSDIQKIDILKKEVGVRIYGDFAEGGVLVLTSKAPPEHKYEEKKSFEKSNILFLVDDKEVTKEEAEAIDPNTIESVDILKGDATKKLYPNNDYDGIIHIHMKKE